MIKKLGIIMTGFMITAVCAGEIHLPNPNKSNTTTLIQSLEARHSDRAFSDREIDVDTLSTILWAAYGVNRPDGKRTIPTALNKQDLKIFVFNKTGIWIYDALTHTLKQLSDQNNLSLFATQDYMASVSTVLVYTGSKEDYSVMHAGSAYQNVELYTASNNMASIVRGYFDSEEVSKILDLPNDQRVIISQAIGWKKTEE